MLVTVREAARQLGVSAEHIRKMICSGRWPFYKLSARGTRIDLEEIKALGRLRAEGERERRDHE